MNLDQFCSIRKCFAKTVECLFTVRGNDDCPGKALAFDGTHQVISALGSPGMDAYKGRGQQEAE
jgi:hypothetical protein